MSYDGGVVFGINADRDAMPDLAVLASGIRAELADLRRLARAVPARSSPAPAPDQPCSTRRLSSPGRALTSIPRTADSTGPRMSIPRTRPGSLSSW